jgi:RecB family exonuclease
LSEYGTAAWPLHPSGLKNLVMCPWRSVMLFLANEAGDESNEAADTGSATHRAVEALHKEGKSPAESIDVMQANVHLYPLADLQTAAGLFLRYASDPGTASAGEVVLCEYPIAFQIVAAPSDPTGAPIELIGEVDQVRRAPDGRLRAWDIKTSSKPPNDVLQNSQQQLAAYCIGASYALGEQVHPGGLIMPRHPVMWVPVTWKFEDIEHILEPVRHIVALIRGGTVYHVPDSGNCKWCHARSPDLCLPRKKRALL